MEILEADGLEKGFNDETAVDGISLSVESGEFFSLLGPSGCGKTTTLRLLAGLESPDTGRIQIHGTDVTDRPARERDTNIVFQELVLFPHMTVEENIGYGLARAGVSGAERTDLVVDALELVDLGGLGDRDPAELSGGQKQRVALARALVNDPAVLLLDEPLSSLDRALKADMRAEFRRIQREAGTTFLYVTHDQESAVSMSDRIAVMRDGQIVERGTPESLYARPATRFVASFLGDAATLSGTVVDIDGSRVKLQRSGGSFTAAVNGTDPTRGDRAHAVVRPEQVAVGHGPFSARVVDSAYKGFYEELTLELGDETRLTARHEPASTRSAVTTEQADGGRSLAVGDRVQVAVTDAALLDNGDG